MSDLNLLLPGHLSGFKWVYMEQKQIQLPIASSREHSLLEKLGRFLRAFIEAVNLSVMLNIGPYILEFFLKVEVTVVSICSESPPFSIQVVWEEWDHMISVSCFANYNSLRFICLFKQPNVYLFKKWDFFFFINNYHGWCDGNNPQTGSVEYLLCSRWAESMCFEHFSYEII